MTWFFGIITTIQIALWVYFILKRKYVVFITTGLLGIYSIWSYIDAYMKYIYIDPCEGIDGCMNETGMIFVFLIIIMLLSTLISLIVFMIDRYTARRKMKKMSD